MYVFDTDTLTHYYKGNENVRRRLELVHGSLFCITIITRVEILKGHIDFLLKANDGASLARAQQFLIESEDELAQLRVLTIDPRAVSRFDEFRQQSRFRKIGRSDLLIASICLAHKAVLVTRKAFPDLSRIRSRKLG